MIHRISPQYFDLCLLSQVIVHVEDVNESPQFPHEIYEASVFSIAPYKTSITQVKVTTPSF